MSETIAGIDARAISSNAGPCSEDTSNGVNCNIVQDPQWFGVLCRRMWPTKPWLMLMQRAGIKERSAHNYASGLYPPSADVLRDLLRSPEGFRVLAIVMEHDPPVWWTTLERHRALGCDVERRVIGGSHEIHSR